MTTIDVTSKETKPTLMDSLRDSWGIGMQRFIWDYTKKGLQIGSLLGTLVVFPYTIFKDIKNLKVLGVHRLLSKQAASLTLGLGISYTWMMIRYLSWKDRQQKLHDETYYLPNDTQYDLDNITVMWGGAAFLLTFLATRKIVPSFGMMSPAIAVGMLYWQLDKNSSSH